MAQFKYQCLNHRCMNSFIVVHDPKRSKTPHCPKCFNYNIKKLEDVIENPQAFNNYKRERAIKKQNKTDELLKIAKNDIRRLEKGIDKVLYYLDTEDTGDPTVRSNIQAVLIDLYNGKDIS